MSVRKRGPAQALLEDTDVDIGTIRLGQSYARVVGIQARNWSAAAKASAGTDAAVKIKLTDADGQVFYLDASDRDYKTATVWLWLRPDPTVTGLSYLAVDGTGAASAADSAGTIPIIASPVTVNVTNGSTATDYFEVYLYVETDDGAQRSTI